MFPALGQKEPCSEVILSEENKNRESVEKGQDPDTVLVLPDFENIHLVEEEVEGHDRLVN